MSFLKQRIQFPQWIRRSVAGVMLLAVLIGVLFTQTELVLCVHDDGHAGIELGLGGQCADWATTLRSDVSHQNGPPIETQQIPSFQKPNRLLVNVSTLQSQEVTQNPLQHLKGNLINGSQPQLHKRCHDIVLLSQGQHPLQAHSLRHARNTRLKEQARKQATQAAFWANRLIAQGFAQFATTAIQPQPPPPQRPPHHRLLRGVILLI